jgi:uncharacterized protein
VNSFTANFFKICACTILLAGCATYYSQSQKTKTLWQNRQFDEAAADLRRKADSSESDRLVYLLELATTLQMARKFDESTRVFIEADKYAEIQDYHSISKIGMATLGSEEMIQYKGESFEKILINVFNALNFLAQSKWDSAMVEARRIDEKTILLQQKTREDYEKNFFAHYLAGLIWEIQGRYDDAFIEYAKAFEIDAYSEQLKWDLFKTSKWTGRNLPKNFPDNYHPIEPPNNDSNLMIQSKIPPKKQPEIVVFFMNGWGPKKDFAPHDYRFPILRPEPSFTQGAKVKISGSNLSQPKELQTQIIYDVETVAIKTLQADYGAMMARKVGAFVAKEVVADQIRQKDEALGLLAWVAMKVADRADLRQWSTLPKNIQMIRVPVPEGEYQISAEAIASNGTSGINVENIKLRTGDKKVLVWRSF